MRRRYVDTELKSPPGDPTLERALLVFKCIGLRRAVTGVHYQRGRKPILVLSLLGVGCGLIAQATCVAKDWSLTTFLMLRVASGAFAGASPVVKAYLADAATPEQLPSFMAWREAACTLAFIVGPTLGGLLFSGGVVQDELC